MGGKKNKNRNKQRHWERPGGPPAANGGEQRSGPEPLQSETSPAVGDLPHVSDAQLVPFAIEELALAEATIPTVSVNPVALPDRSASGEPGTAETTSISEVRSVLSSLRVARERFEALHAELIRERDLIRSQRSVVEDSINGLAAKSAEIERRSLELRALEAEHSLGFPEKLREFRLASQHDLEVLRAGVLEQQRELVALRTTLQLEREELQERRAEIAAEAAKLEAEKAFSEMRDGAVRARAEREFSLRIEQLQFGEESARSEAERQKARADELRQQVKRLEDALGSAGGTSIQDLSVDRERLRGELEKARSELLARPSAITVEQLRRSQDELERLAFECTQLRYQLQAVTEERDRARVPLTERETYEHVNRSLTVQNRSLKEANDLLVAEVGGRLGEAATRNPFLELAHMDASDAEEQKSGRRTRREASLPELVSEIRNRMALDERLFYDEATIRCFVAGMSMSRLHLLQGISGTGKTSLPIAVANALGGHSEKIAVQAGWRDRQDLLGFYNTFDKRYHETAFLRALYAAQCPRWKDCIYFVVLDEMNLSHIEQFGADLLSELEKPRFPNSPQLSLLDARPPSWPKLLVDNGKAILIPKNVWFVGTANHDETTKDFADKTYDRAHTMELPRNRVDFQPAESATRQPAVPVDLLVRLFEDARNKHQGEVRLADRALGALEPDLKDGLGVGWGNRLEGQMRKFVPVCIASGGTTGEALDHLLATKLLRKIRLRHDVRISDLRKVRSSIAAQWKSLKLGGSARNCDELLAAEIDRRAFDDGGGES